MIISQDHFRIVTLYECTCGAVNESVPSGAVAVVSNIHYIYHWCTAGLPVIPTAATCRISIASPILLHPSLIILFRVVPTLVSHVLSGLDC